MRPNIGVAQSAGDVAYTGFNSDISDGFAVVVFTAFSAGDVIHFNSQEWDGTDFTGSGGDFTWNAPVGGISSGTVLIFNDVQGTPTVNIGTITDDANMNLSGSGDVIYAYTGTDKNTPDTPFLGAIATAADEYDGGEGTLTGTGLTQGTTAILLSNNIDVAEFMGDRSGNTPNGYRTELNDVASNWQEENGTGDQSGLILPFDDTNFVIINPPTVAFTASSATVAEDGGSATLTVELVEASGDAVSVDVVFLPGSSTADASDIDNYTTTPVSFIAGANSGDTQTVTVNITNPTPSDFEGDELAVFQLQDISTGSIISPEILNLTITDDDAPDVVINEFLADPPTGILGDANGDGTRDSGDDEFMELVNNSSTDIDITGWELSDDGGSNITHTFVSGTVLPAGKAIVIFGGGNPTGNFGGSLIQTAGDLSFTNGGGFATLLDDNGNIIQNIPYGDEGGADAGDDQSVTRDSDVTGNFVQHSNATGSGGAIFSPGTQIDGTAFGNATYAIGIRGIEGWRFVGTPTESTTFDDLFANLWTQGLTGSDAPSAGTNIFGWQQGGGGTFSPVSDMNTNLTPGQGYIVFVYEDDDFRTPGVQGGFPKTISTDNTENASPVSVPVSANDDNTSGDIDGDEGYNLLSNPYGTDVSVAAVIDALEAADPSATVNANISVWNPNAGSGNGGYEPLTDGDQLAPFQAFFARYTTDGVSANASFGRSELAANQGAPFFGQPDDTQPIVNFEMYMGNGNKFDTYRVEFNQDGTVGEDRYDAYKLFSLNASAINIFSTVGDDIRLAKNVLPSISSFEEGSELRIPFSYAIPRSGEYTFSWSDLSEIPEQLELFMVDNQTGRKINMRSQQELKVDLSVETEQQSSVNKISSPTLSKTETSEGSPRFELLIVAAEDEIAEPEPLQEPVVLSPNYPNPFNQSGTTIDIQVREKMEVKMTVWNIVGQKVGTMVDNEVMEPNRTYSPTWNVPANMPSGIYICKVEAGGMVMTRKMTLVK